jgi:hypothetical protein
MVLSGYFLILKNGASGEARAVAVFSGTAVGSDWGAMSKMNVQALGTIYGTCRLGMGSNCCVPHNS